MARYGIEGHYVDGNGKVVPSGTVQLFEAGTTTAANFYEASSGGSQVTSTTTDSAGKFEIYVDDSDYDSNQKFDIKLSKTNYQSQLYYNWRPFPFASAGYVDTIKSADIITKSPWVDVRAFGAVLDGTTDDSSAFESALQSGKRIYIPSGKTMKLSSDSTWNYTDGATEIIAYGATINYEGSGYMVTANMHNGAADLDTLKFYGGKWNLGSSGVGLFKLSDLRYGMFADMWVEDNSTAGGIAWLIQNDYYWCERNRFFNIRETGFKHLVYFDPDQSNGGTLSFARTIMENVQLQGGNAGEEKIYIHDGGSGKATGVYDCVFRNIVGNIADNSVVMRLHGSMGGTVIGPVHVEDSAGGTAYVFSVDTLTGARPNLIGPTILRNTSLYEGSPTGLIFDEHELKGGLIAEHGTDNYGIDILGRVGAWKDNTYGNPMMGVSSNQAGSYPFDAFGHILMQANASSERDFVIAAGDPPSVALKVKGTTGNLLLNNALGVGNSATGTSLGSVVKKIEIFDEDGNSLGYLPVYDAIT